MKKKILAFPYLIWLFVFVLIPLMLIIYFSFATQTPNGTVFSFESYLRFFDDIYMKVMLRSINVALVTTIICLALAYPLAMILSSNQKSSRTVIVLLIILPMWMNSLLRTYAWMTLLENNGIFNNLLNLVGLPKVNFLYGNGAIIFGMVYNFLPFMVLPIYNVLCKIDRSLIEASHDLGGNKFVTFRRVILPLSMPGVVTGIIMVFMPALTTFVITRLLGGGQVTLIGNIIEEQFTRTRDWAFGAAVSMILMIIILTAISFMSKDDSFDKGGGLF